VTDLSACCADRIRLPEYLPLDADPDAAGVAREERRRAAGLLEDVTDAHVHLFPDAFLAALWRWFDAHAWSIQFRAGAEAALEALAAIGTSRVVAMVFSHKPDAARYLNRWLAELCRAAPQVVGVGTVLPGEPDARAIVHEAIAVHGLRGIKLHCHVQKMSIDDPRVLEVLGECAALGVPAVVHSGRQPATTAYGIDPLAICGVDRTRRVLEALPDLRLVVPHLGADEFDAHLALLDQHEHLYLDTAMSCGEYFADRPRIEEVAQKAHRILFGTDFPIIPYEADRELRLLARRIVDDRALEHLLRGTAATLWR
jgi:predicted TIM-barrel fold metal-dependent hydrolase